MVSSIQFTKTLLLRSCVVNRLQIRGLLLIKLRIELPGYAPGAGYRMLEALLGRVKDLSAVSDFTTQTGDFTGTSPVYKSSVKKASLGHMYEVFNH